MPTKTTSRKKAVPAKTKPKTKKSSLKKVTTKAGSALKKTAKSAKSKVKKVAENVHQGAKRAHGVGQTVVTAGEIITKTADFVDSMVKRPAATAKSKSPKPRAKKPAR